MSPPYRWLKKIREEEAMGKAEVLALLRDGEYISGEEISRSLGISRAAV